MNEKNNATPTVSKTSPKSALLSVCTLFRKYSVSPCITQLFKLRGIFQNGVIDLQFTANSARRFIPLFLLLALSLLSGCKAAQTEPAPPSPSFYESSSFIAHVSPSLPMPQSPATPSPSPSLCLHRPELLPALAPTCTKEGLSEGLYCPLCGLTLRAQSVLSPTGHRYEQSRCTLCGDYEESKGLTFALRDGYYAVTGIGSFVGKTLVIPQIHEGLPVKEIAEGAFYNAYGNDETAGIDQNAGFAGGDHGNRQGCLWVSDESGGAFFARGIENDRRACLWRMLFFKISVPARKP